MAMVVVALVLSNQLVAIEAQSYEACVEEVSNYLAQTSISDPVKSLVTKSSEFFPDYTVLLEDDPQFDSEYFDAMEKFGFPDGCVKINDHVIAIRHQVPCIFEHKINVARLVELPKLTQAAKDVLEADFLCEIAAL